MTQRTDRASLRPSYDYVIVGAGAAGCVLASELSMSGADVLLIESGGNDDAPTVPNPSVWFYNVGGTLDYGLPIVPTARLNQREFTMTLVTSWAVAPASTRWSGRAAWSATSKDGRGQGQKAGRSKIIDANYLGTDQDLRAIIGAIHAARELGHRQDFNEVRDVELIPGPRAGERDVDDLARTGSASFGHAAGTCEMGIDSLAVVDPELRVHGCSISWSPTRPSCPASSPADQCSDADDRRKGGAADPGRRLSGRITMARTIDVDQHLLPDFFWREMNEGASS
jgi:choline dehydrogenase-like flavoprotein